MFFFRVIKNVISFMFNLECFFLYLVLCVHAVCMQIYRSASVSQTNTLGKRIYIGHYGNGFGRCVVSEREKIHTQAQVYNIMCVQCAHLYSFLSIPLDVHQTTTELQRKSRYLQRNIHFSFTTKS